MAAIPVTIVGTMTYTDLSVGGGPIFPPAGSPPSIWPGPGYPAHPIAPGGPPPGIWPSPGYPAHPIYNPPGIWGGGNAPFPTPPIYIPAPPQPEGPPTGDGRWVWVSPPGVWCWLPAQEPGKPQPMP